MKLSFLRSKANQTGRTGLHRSPVGVAVAQVTSGPAGMRPHLSVCQYHPISEERSFVDVGRSLPNRAWPVVSVLAPEAYNMLLVEAPDVAENELKAAVKWRIRELLDFHVDDAVIEVFPMPLPGRGGPTRMMYAIAAREQEVRQRVEDSAAAGLNLEVIDILELALRNIAVLLDRDDRGVALLYLHRRGGVLLLVRGGVLYLARHLEAGTEQLRNEAMRETLIDRLALEVQRSLDYYESNYEQDSIPVAYTWGMQAADIRQLDASIGIAAKPIELDALFELDAEFEAEAVDLALPAIGGALRREVA
jgi:MSHA biogenesis protein MshI